jgi:hypothetical protein
MVALSALPDRIEGQHTLGAEIHPGSPPPRLELSALETGVLVKLVPLLKLISAKREDF